MGEFANQTVVVDGSAWLHRGAFACARELATGVETTRHLDFCVHMTKMLLHYKVTPIFVLDGMSLPAKQKTNEERNKSRDANRELGLEALRRNDVFAAEKYFQKAIHVTSIMGRDLKRRLWNELRVACITAPYEGDPSLLLSTTKFSLIPRFFSGRANGLPGQDWGSNGIHHRGQVGTRYDPAYARNTALAPTSCTRF